MVIVPDPVPDAGEIVAHDSSIDAFQSVLDFTVRVVLPATLDIFFVVGEMDKLGIDAFLPNCVMVAFLFSFPSEIVMVVVLVVCVFASYRAVIVVFPVPEVGDIVIHVSSADAVHCVFVVRAKVVVPAAFVTFLFSGVRVRSGIKFVADWVIDTGLVW